MFLHPPIQELEDKSEHVIYYISKSLSVLSINYNHHEKMDLAGVLLAQNIFHYILMHKTKVMANSSPMQYILGQQLITGKFSRWIVILQEFKLEFSTPKTKKGLTLEEFITNLPMGTGIFSPTI